MKSGCIVNVDVFVKSPI